MALSPVARRQWGGAGLAALGAHAIALALVVSWARAPQEPPPPEPVVLIELPTPAGVAAIAATATANPMIRPVEQTPLVQTPSLPQPVPTVAAPLPRDVVSVAPSPVPTAPAAAAPALTAPAMQAPATTGTAAANAPGDSAKARQQEADYFALVSAHLNRRKTYPVEAKKARQQGVVTVRFTVDRAGNVSGASIKRSSGSDLLDAATLDLLARVAPLPRMPASIKRDSVTLSLPIDYSLRTS